MEISSDKCPHIPGKTADDCPKCIYMRPGPLEGSGVCKYSKNPEKGQEEKMSDMKPATTLRELLKPPFHHDGTPTGMVYDGNTRLLDIRGWGFFQYYANGEQLQDEFKEFVVQALNEKWEREKPHDPEELVDCMSCMGLEEMEEYDPGHYRCKKRRVDGIDPYVKEPCNLYEKD